MSFEDFVHQFTNCTLCHVINTSIFSLRDRWHVFKQAGDWHPGVSAGGCVQNKETFLRNPQVQLVEAVFSFVFVLSLFRTVESSF